MKTTTYILLIFVQIMLCASLAGQNWTKARAQQVNKEAQEMATAGNWSEAFRHLDQNIAALGSDPKVASYRAYFQFSKAYLLQQTPTGNAENNLRRAQRAYEEALRNQPGDLKILNNLVIVSQSIEDWGKAERYAQMALEVDESNTADWYVTLGDIYQSQRNWQASWKAYSTAIDQDPERLDAAQKLLALYEHYDYSDADLLFKKCLELNDNGLSEMAAKGLADLIAKVCLQTAEVRDYIVLAWAGVLADNNWVRPRLQKQLAELQCSFEPFVVLQSNLTNGWQVELARSNWWQQSERRWFYYQALQKSWADHLLATGNKRKAMELYRSGRQMVRDLEDYSEEIYGRNGVLEMELLIQLARLYGDNELDPESRNFKALESELFQQKGEAYRSDDLESIQKFHTILGLIYVDREEWGGTFAQNARFQLTRAIATAKRRAEQDPALYTPLPHLYKYLGDTYTALGDHHDAADAYLNAAVDYMETDNLAFSRAMVQKADNLLTTTSSRQLRRKRSEVQSILSARENINQLDAGAFNKNSERYFRKTIGYNWLDNPDQFRSIESSVVERQAFKALSDLKTRAQEVGANDESNSLRSEVKEKVSDVSVLSSQQDVLRIKQLDLTDKALDYRSIKYQKLEQRQELKKDYDIILPNRSGQKTRVIKTEKNGG